MSGGHIFQAAVILGAALVGGWSSASMTSSAQLEVYGALRDTAGIVFGVLGIWIAVLYSPGLHALYSKGARPEEEGEFEKVRPLLLPMAYSVIILVATVPAEFVHAIGPVNPLFSTLTGQVLSVGLLGSLVAMQVFSVLLTLLPAFDLRHRFARQEARRRALRNRSP